MNRLLARIVPVLLIAILFGDAGATARADENATFDEITNQFLDGYFKWRPGSAVQLGLHEYDGQLSSRSKASITTELARLKEFETKIAAIDLQKLDTTRQFDDRILLNAIRAEIFDIDDVRHYQTNPMTYVLGDEVNAYIERDFAPAEQRLQSVLKIEGAARQLTDAAKANLDDVLARPLVETAIRSASGAVEFLEHDLPIAFAEVKDPALMARFKEVNHAAAETMRDYASWLQKEKLAKVNANFALGRDRYVKMLATQEMISLPPERILEIGMAQLQHEQENFRNAARQIDPSHDPNAVYKLIQKDHPTAEGLIPDTRRDLEAIRQYVIDHQLVTVPSEIRARVRETPGYARASTFASMSSPGAFETRAKEANYYVTPVENDWSAQRKEEWLTSFNYYELDVVSIHEAYPGHYVQFLHLNASPATRIEKIFGSYAFIEGWAHYSEQMLLDEGFGAGPNAAKYRITQSSEALLRLCRLCCSIKMHTQGMTVDEATTFFQNNCYYEREPANAEATRGTFDPGYLYYTIGKMQLLKLRDDYRKQEGANFSLQRFHDAVLSHGMPPVRLLREMMLKDPTIAGKDL